MRLRTPRVPRARPRRAQEERVVAAVAGAASTRPAGVEVGVERVAGRRAEHAHALLAALAQHADLAVADVDVGHACTGDLADAQAGRVGALDDGPVTQLDGLGDAGRPRPPTA